MRKITTLFFALFALSQTVQARSPIPAQTVAELGYITRIGADSSDHRGHIHQGFAQVSVDNYGYMTVSFDSAFKRGQIALIRQKLSVNSFLQLKQKIFALSNVEVSHEQWLTVCAVMPPYGADKGLGLAVREGIDRSSNFYSAEGLREVLSADACWMGYSVRPAVEGFESTARELQFGLRVLAEEALKRHFQNKE